MKTPSKKTNKPDLDFYPKSLLSELTEVLESEFIRLPIRKQVGYTNILWSHSGIIRHNHHRKRSDSFAMDNKELDRYFTDFRDFKAINSKGYYLRPSQRPKIDKYLLRRKDEKGAVKYEPTKWLIKTVEAHQAWKPLGVKGSKNGYKFSPKIRDLVDTWFAKLEEELVGEVGFVNYKGETPLEVGAKLGGAIFRDKTPIPSEVNINVNVKIDSKELHSHIYQLINLKEQLEVRGIDKIGYKDGLWEEVAKVLTNEEKRRKERRLDAKASAKDTLGGVNRGLIHNLPLQSLLSKDFKLEGVKQRLSEIRALLSILREDKDSAIPVFYTEVSTGRYTAKGAVLQGYHKSVRYAALKGCYEYDLEAAHQNILIQLLDNKGSNFPELKVVREYIAKKQQVRKRLAKELNTSVATVKEIIQELTYGGQLSRSPEQAVYKTCNGDKALLGRVVTNEWLIKLAATFKLAHKHLIGDNKKLVNVVGIKFDYENKKGEPAELAHILQGYERLVLDTIIKHSNRDDIALLVHDCVVFYNKQSTDKLSQIVEQETGLCLAFSEEEY